MGFNTALSGLRAASSDLDVIGNNIANGGTVGFKRSRAEFHDLYSQAMLGGGNSKAGNGVFVQTVAQQFGQGNIRSTDRNLDMVINGGGFFVTKNPNGLAYTRQGIFSLNKDGYIVTNTGDFLQGFVADASGVIIPGALSDLQINAQYLDPRQTSGVDIDFNLDSREQVLARRGSITTSNNTAVVANAQLSNINGYSAGSFVLQDISQTPPVTKATLNVPSAANMQASAIASELVSNGEQYGIMSASANTRVKVNVANIAALLGSSAPVGASIVINNQAVSLSSVNNVNELAVAISNLNGISAQIDSSAPNEIRIYNNSGDNITVSVSNTGTNVAVQGAVGSAFTNAGGAVTVNDGNTATVGGEITLQLENDTQIGSATSNIFNTTTITYTPFAENEFDPTKPASYNHATQVQIFDSLGNSHTLSSYFVKEDPNPLTPNVADWSMYLLIDGQDIGDPVVSGGSATRARFTVQFDRDGNLLTSSPIVVTNWIPLDSAGNPINALQPLNVASGGNILPLPDPPTSSNFVFNITGSTQFGSLFAVESLSQNGYTVGRMTDLSVSETGIIFGRYSNGQNTTLGQVALANFANSQGLQPIGKTSWLETFDSGVPVIGTPNTGTLGSLRAGSLEEANVDVAEELVGLIIAQRNYQANAKTIETEDTVTQTIINLR
ncbi:flagellar hook-basal body complex protein [Endozoicomonas sp. SM1973]|uniref:Flagellar hook protein FlgE n=1 Tax=Spartinivicinus marinus TaxID=2994442 RepID=A0A853IJX9_9GAMM|nr:flagellar hook-basal body complex protein [Spartinivicinus marinus]MCX4024607.1 flagellar hook-basal body complex protein [Spartinivicinus marinus]NYZ69385.1 flagellar hook-basal body complex protein [Spartinivicinus marinus]